VTTPEDTAVAINLSAIDVDGDDLTYTVLDGPTTGALTGTPPALTYTPAANFSGSDSFTYQAADAELASNVATVAITVTAVQDAPIAVPDAATVDQNSGPNPIVVGANDSDPDGDAFSISEVTQPANGTVAIVDGLTVSYTPALNYVGEDSFTYAITDSSGLSASTTVTVTVFDPVPDYGFLGLLDPWRPNNYRVNAGNSIPLKWYYTAQGTEAPVASSTADPQIIIRGPFGCGPNDSDSDALEVVEDAGSSDLRYSSDSFLWQFNWDTAGLEPGCYNIRIQSFETSQVDGPFKVQLR
jgi:hypothetical protein